jgi:fatty acid desaturase
MNIESKRKIAVVIYSLLLFLGVVGAWGAFNGPSWWTLPLALIWLWIANFLTKCVVAIIPGD